MRFLFKQESPAADVVCLRARKKMMLQVQRATWEGNMISAVRSTRAGYPSGALDRIGGRSNAIPLLNYMLCLLRGQCPYRASYKFCTYHHSPPPFAALPTGLECRGGELHLASTGTGLCSESSAEGHHCGGMGRRQFEVHLQTNILCQSHGPLV
jgi:hypothetical protein